MNSRTINLAMRALPAESRKHDGPAISSLAAEMIEGGSSRISQARGIAGYGLKKRLLLNLEWVRELPWGAALWLIALPIACVQAFMLVYSSRMAYAFYFSDPWHGWWTLAMFGAVALTVVGAAKRSRLILAPAAAGLLALLLFDEYRNGGGMMGGVSHTFDFAFPFVTDTVLAPVALVLIPSTILLLIASAVQAPESSGSRKVSATWCWALFAALILLPIMRKATMPSFFYSSVGLTALFVGVLALTVLAVKRERPEYGLAAGLLLGSQWILLACQMVLSLDNILFGLSGFSLLWMIVPMTVGLIAPLAAAFWIIRYAAGPRRLP